MNIKVRYMLLKLNTLNSIYIHSSFLFILIFIFLLGFKYQSLAQNKNEYNGYIIKFKQNTSEEKKQSFFLKVKTTFLEQSNDIKYKNIELFISGKPVVDVKNSHLSGKIAKINQSNNPQPQIDKNLLNLSTYYKISGNYMNTQYFQNLLSEIINLQDYEDIVESVSPNFIYHIEQTKEQVIGQKVSQDSLSNQQWALTYFKAQKLWEIATGLGVKIGVVDTGIDWTHPDLSNQIWYNKQEDINKNGRFDPWSVNEIRDGVSGDLDGIDNDGNGFTDDVIGYDFVDQIAFNPGDYLDPDPIPFDENGHGTNVASVIVAQKDNYIGIAGLAYSSKVITARAFDALGSGESDDIASGIVYCALNGARIINLSFGERFRSPIIESAIKFANSLGIIVVASSGNNNWWFSHYPSDLQEVISVGAFNKNLQRETSISNYGSFVDILAPGADIQVAAPNNRYIKVNGTSLSAPYVCALVAMILEKKPDLSPAQVITLIKSNATDIGPIGWDFENSAGLLNPLKTLENLTLPDVRFLLQTNELFIDRTKQKNLELKANIIEPLLSDYKIEIASGLYPKSGDFITLDSGSYSVANLTVANIDLTKLKDTLYTISLVVNKKNKTQVVSRIKLYLNSSFSPLQLTKQSITPVLKDDKRAVQFDIYANKNCFLEIRYKKSAETNFQSIFDYEKYTSNHNLLVEDIFERGINYDIEVNLKITNIPEYLTNSNDKTYKTKFSFDRNSAYPLDWSRKTYSLPPSFLNPKIIKFQSSVTQNIDDEYIVTNDLEGGVGFGPLSLYKFQSETKEFKKIDSLSEVFINVGVGKINDEYYILTNANYVTRVYKLEKNGNGELFISKNLVYDTQQKYSQWAGGFFDFDGDGNDEMINFNDSSFVLYKFNSTKFEEIGRTQSVYYNVNTDNGVKKQKRFLSTQPSFTIGKFNSQMKGYNQLIYEIEGNIIVCDWLGDKFAQKNSYSYLTGKGKSLRAIKILENYDTISKSNAIVILSSGDADVSKLEQVQNNLWKVEVLEEEESDFGEKVLHQTWEESIFGVKDGFVKSLGFSYKNSLNVLDISGKGKNDIVLCLTPNLYILKNVTKDRVESKQISKKISWTSGVFSNNVLFNDFDKNDVSELGVNFFGGTYFLELVNEDNNTDNNLTAISGFSGYPLNENSVSLKWDTFEEQNPNIRYEIFEIKDFSKGELIKLWESNSNTTSALINSLIENKTYNLTIRAKDISKNPVIVGSFTLPYYLSLFPHKQILAKKVRVQGELNLLVEFSGKLPKNLVQFSNFILTDAKGEAVNITSAVVLNDTLLSLGLGTKLRAGNYNLQVLSFLDYYHTPTIETEHNFNFSLQEEEYLYIQKSELKNNRLHIYFSENVQKSTISKESFSLSPYGQILEVIAESETSPIDTNELIVVFSDEVIQKSKGSIFIVTCKNLFSTSGLKIVDGAGCQAAFVIRQNDLDLSFVTPNPLDRSLQNYITFANLTQLANIEIFDTFGNKIAVVYDNDGDGGVDWDLLDNNGQMIPVGVYLYKITGYNDKGEFFDSGFKKFMIIN